MDFAIVVTLLAAGVRSGTPILYAALGEIFAERSGVLNLGVEGMMLMGAMTGYGVAWLTGDPWIGLSAAILVGGLMALRTAYFEPMQAFDPTVSFAIVTMAVVGGSDDARGPLLGAAFFTLLSEALWVHLPEVYMVVLGALLILFVLFIPQGIAGALTGRRHRSAP